MNTRGKSISFLLLLLVSVVADPQSLKKIWLDDLPIQTFSSSIRPVQAKTNYAHDSIQIKGVYYQRGVGAQSVCILSFYLDKKAKRFTAMIGADDNGNKEIPLKFYVVGDQKILFESGEMRVGDAAKKVDIDLAGIVQLGLLVTDDVGGVNNKRTYCDWADAQLTMIGDNMPGHLANDGKRYILTPPPAKAPQINSAKIFGATPGNPFLYTIAATGERPMHFSADNLPKGLSVDPSTGIITGKVDQRGTYLTILKAKNKFGEATRELKIKIDDTIALTPPLGWNGWNALAGHLNKGNVMASACAMVTTGLRDHGWSYINIDDSWQGKREGPLDALQPNENFSNIKQMVDEIHSLGLKAGIYSTPYISSYGSYVGGSSDFPHGGETHDLIKINHQPYMHIGKYRFETNDAKQMAEWGFDFLKYDWRIDVNSAERMQDALKKSGRDIVFSLSNNAPFDKVKDWIRVSNMYRTGPDIRDSWNDLYMLAFTLDKWGPYGGPGHWNDPDMMVVGNVATGSDLHPTRLTPDEQYSHLSIYSLLAAPMLIGCELDKLDPFTLNLLSNDEVIAINQDPLGKPARLLADENGVQVWVKPMEDGSYAVGLFNTDNYGKTAQSYFRWGNEKPKSFEFDFLKVGLNGKWKLRDVWRQKTLGTFDKSFKTTIPFHGVVLLRMYPAS
ncbi:MAG TPA: NPCBM/NEW2 domain-containing protein [Chitinophagaceae bacterium]|nr:NPCBM/NEW2 domain-containing protein [Chitinophagaceae bacterium]